MSRPCLRIVLASHLARLLGCATVALIAFIATPSSGRPPPVARFDALPRASERLARQQSGVGVLRSLKYNRDQEAEADHIGIFLMTFAGYDPHKAVIFWERMHQRMAGQHPPEFLSDHPSDEHRIEAMKQWVPKVLAGKKAFDRGDIAPAPAGR